MAKYRPEFEKGLGLLARAFDAVCEKGHSRPVLVGGAVVEYYTGGLIHSGDFDISTISQDVLERELEKLGFVREVNGSRLARGLFHPHLDMSVEVVSKPLFDGKSD